MNVSCALDPRSLSVGISKLCCTDLVFVNPGVKINSAYYRDVLLSKQLLPVMREVSGIFRLSTGQCPSTPARDTVQLVLCCYWIFGQQTALTLIRLITGSGASSNSECTSRGCTTLTNWNSVCSKCGITSTRASLTMQLASGASIFVHVCRRTADTWSICCRKQYDYLQSTVWQHKRFIFVKYDTLLYYCHLQWIWAINFPKVVQEHT